MKEWLPLLQGFYAEENQAKSAWPKDHECTYVCKHKYGMHNKKLHEAQRRAGMTSYQGHFP